MEFFSDELRVEWGVSNHSVDPGDPDVSALEVLVTVQAELTRYAAGKYHEAWDDEDLEIELTIGRRWEDHSWFNLTLDQLDSFIEFLSSVRDKTAVLNDRMIQARPADWAPRQV